jgi:hypothetical protein
MFENQEQNNKEGDERMETVFEPHVSEKIINAVNELRNSSNQESAQVPGVGIVVLVGSEDYKKMIESSEKDGRTMPLPIPNQEEYVLFP